MEVDRRGRGNNLQLLIDAPGVDLQRRAWQWALANRNPDGSFPSGAVIGAAHGRRERWGRLVKKAGQAGAFGSPGSPETSTPHSEPGEAVAAGSEGAS